MGRSKVNQVRLNRLCLQVSHDTGLDVRDVRLAINELTRVVGEHLGEGREVCIDGLGILSPNYIKQHPSQVKSLRLKNKVEPGVVARVTFRQAKNLKEKMR